MPLILSVIALYTSLLQTRVMSGAFLKKLENGGTIVIAEGYLWEMERRCFLKFGDFLPEVVLERPSALRNLHEEFALAGSDVIEAFTYYAYREQMRLRGREDDVEKLNRQSLRIAREVADEHDKLMAGNLSNTPLYEEDRPDLHQKIYDMFKEQVVWAVEGGADYIIGETFANLGEASIALRAIKENGNGLPAVITLAAYNPDRTTDEVPIPEACRRLEELGAAVVGINCARGPDTMLPLVKEIQKVCKGPIAALPVPYRTTPAEKTFFMLKDKVSGTTVYPDNLDCVRSSRTDVRRFAEQAKEIGVQYVGLCCGNSAAMIRELAQVYGRTPPALKYSCDQTNSFIFGENTKKYGPEVLKTRDFMIGNAS